MPNEQPTRGFDRFACPRCNAFSHHVWADLEVLATEGDGGWGNRAFSDEPDAFAFTGSHWRVAENIEMTWAASLCLSCNAGTVWRGDRMIYPLTSTIPVPHPDMPAAARELYEEARNVYPLSRRASAALARAALEALLKALPDAPSNTRLDDLIAGLQGLVGNALWKVLTALRYVGNTTLHGEGSEDLVIMFLDGSESEIAAPLFGAINAVVEELITQPAHADELYAMIPAGVRATAEQKAAKRS